MSHFLQIMKKKNVILRLLNSHMQDNFKLPKNFFFFKNFQSQWSFPYMHNSLVTVPIRKRIIFIWIDMNLFSVLLVFEIHNFSVTPGTCTCHWCHCCRHHHHVWYCMSRWCLVSYFFVTSAVIRNHCQIGINHCCCCNYWMTPFI
jgi:hypothetical protein